MLADHNPDPPPDDDLVRIILIHFAAIVLACITWAIFYPKGK